MKPHSSWPALGVGGPWNLKSLEFPQFDQPNVKRGASSRRSFGPNFKWSSIETHPLYMPDLNYLWWNIFWNTWNSDFSSNSIILWPKMRISQSEERVFLSNENSHLWRNAFVKNSNFLIGNMFMHALVCCVVCLWWKAWFSLFFYFYKLPIIKSVQSNFCFLVNIIRVFLPKFVLGKLNYC